MPTASSCVNVFETLSYASVLRNPDLNRWEIDEGGGSSLRIMGWKKMLTPPGVIAQGYMSDGVACGVAFTAGVIWLFHRDVWHSAC